MASIDAQLRLLVPRKVSEDDKLIEYDALLLDRFLNILQDLHGEDLRETAERSLICADIGALMREPPKRFQPYKKLEVELQARGFLKWIQSTVVQFADCLLQVQVPHRSSEWHSYLQAFEMMNRIRNPAMAGGYPQAGYQARPPSNWGTPGAPPMQQPGYGGYQSGAYPGPSPQYNMSQPAYAGYPSQPTSGGYSASWDQTSVPPAQQTTQGSGYDYYSNQQQPSQQPQAPAGSAAAVDSTGYGYGQPQASGYTQDGYGGYHAPQSGYGQPTSYDQQQGYNSAPSYGNVTSSTQEGQTPAYAAQGDSTQAPPPVQPSSMGQQGYGTGQQPSPNPSSYPAQGATQAGYGIPPTSQGGYGNQPPAQSGYPGYGPPQTQKPLANPPVYGQTQQSPGTAGGYGQPGYPHSQPPTSGYAQPDSGAQRAPPSGYGAAAAAAQPGYGAGTYGGQAGYSQGPASYNYGGGYSQAAYPADGNGAAATQTVQQSGVATKSPQS